MASSNTELVDKLVEEGRLETAALIKAMKAVDRAYFLPDELKSDAYTDRPLRVAYKETFIHQSAPHMYAIVMEHLAVQPGDTVLNVGSGTGYLSTMLAWFAGADGVSHGVEQFESNVTFAREHAMTALQRIDNVVVPLTFFAGNIFSLDTANNIQYDRIYVGANCAPEQVAFFHPLLKDGGVLLVPSDGKMLKQTRQGGSITSKAVLGVRFAELSQPAGASKFTCLTRVEQAKRQAKRQEQERIGHQLTRQASIDAGETAEAAVAAIAISDGGGMAQQSGFVTPLQALLREHGLDKFYADFEVENVTLENAKYLDAPSLKQLGIPLGPRMHLLAIFSGSVAQEQAAADTDNAAAQEAAAAAKAEQAAADAAKTAALEAAEKARAEAQRAVEEQAAAEADKAKAQEAATAAKTEAALAAKEQAEADAAKAAALEAAKQASAGAQRAVEERVTADAAKVTAQKAAAAAKADTAKEEQAAAKAAVQRQRAAEEKVRAEAEARAQSAAEAAKVAAAERAAKAAAAEEEEARRAAEKCAAADAADAAARRKCVPRITCAYAKGHRSFPFVKRAKWSSPAAAALPPTVPSVEAGVQVARSADNL